ncbi:MAG: PAS domain S-box protein, partial [Gammaproteobacteria bacterium]|nr:PAS domain S-box protein [Gammaproteobacteria bacterium]
TQNSLQLAACIGNQFELHTLALVSEKAPQAVAASLSEALQAGVIIPLDDDYKYIAALDDAAQMKVAYKFTHDRVQQGAYALIEPAKRQAVHWQMGQHLLAQIPLEQQEEHIFDIVNHLNQGRSLLESEADRGRLIDLNLQAGRRAMTATAYGSALVYLEVGLALLPEDAWQTDYELALQLYTLAAQAAHLHGSFNRMTQFSETVLQQAHMPLDQAKIHEISIDFYLSQGQLPEAVQTALHALNLLGMTIPAQPEQRDVEQAMQEARTALATLGPTLDIQLEHLLNQAEMTDPLMVAALNILNKGNRAAFYHNAKLGFLMQVAGVKLSVQYGLGVAIPQLFAFYANHLCGQGDIETGYQIGQFVLKLGEHRDLFASATARTTINAMVRSWQEHIRHILPNLLVDHQTLLENGELFEAGLTLHVYCNRSLMVGKNLAQLEQEMALYGSTLQHLKQVRTLETHQTYWQFVLNLRGQMPVPWQLEDELFDLETRRSQWLETKNIIGLMSLSAWQCALSYLFQQFTQAAEQATSAEPYLDAHTVGPYTPQLYLYDSLARLAVYFDVSPAEQQQILDRVGSHQAKMKYWAKHAPMNFLHKYLLVEAELARVLGNDGQAREYYDQAIELAHEHQYINEEALAYDVAARFYLTKGNLTIAHPYLREAHYAYQRWGATAKVEDLESRYPEVFAPVGTATSELAGPSTRSLGTAQMITGSLDLTSVLKASQALSGEIVLAKLLTRLMKLLIENAGAQTGSLLFEKEESWVIEAQGANDQDEVTVLQSRPIAPLSPPHPPQGGESEEGLLPVSIIHYVARTQESVVLNEATAEGQFSQDPYLVQQQPQAVLCMPLLHQGRLSGILYLENNLTGGAFTPDRLEMLKLLSSQAAIALENARLHTDLQASEKKYRTIFEDSRDMIFITSVDGQIIDVNPTCETLLGYSRPEMLQLQATTLYAQASDRARFQAEMIQHGAVQDFEVTLRRKDGREIAVMMTATVRQSKAGTILGYQGIVRDITAQKEAEAERLRALELQKGKEAAELANQAKSDFLSSMSHELRTPLNGILGYVQILKQRNQDPNTLDGLDIIQRSGDHLLTLINDILDLAKIEAGKIDFTPADIHLSNFLSQIVRIIQARAEVKDIALSYEPLSAL